jgi:AraC-like DNA-binding protein
MERDANFLYFMNMLKQYPRLKVNRAGITRVPPDWSWDTINSSWQDSDVWIILRGHGQLTAPEGKFQLRPGDCYWFRAGERYIARNIDGGRISVFYCHFDLISAQGRIVRPAADKLPALHRRMTDMEALKPILERIAALHHQQPRRTEEVNAWGSALLAEIASQDRQSAYNGLELQQHQDLESLCAEIRAMPDKYISVQEMARQMGYTPQHFARIFRKFKGTSPKNFLVHARIERAKIYLASSYSIGRIAELLGYNDIYFFSKQFKIYTGSNPSDWRNSLM